MDSVLKLFYQNRKKKNQESLRQFILPPFFAHCAPDTKNRILLVNETEQIQLFEIKLRILRFVLWFNFFFGLKIFKPV